jgi:hypothetical protein
LDLKKIFLTEFWSFFDFADFFDKGFSAILLLFHSLNLCFKYRRGHHGNFDKQTQSGLLSFDALDRLKLSSVVVAAWSAAPFSSGFIQTNERICKNLERINDRK